MDSLIEFEKDLLENDFISKTSSKHNIESDVDEEEDDLEQPGGIENKTNDKFDRYREVADLFGDKVFIYDEIKETVTLSENFKAKLEYLLCIKCMEKMDDEDIRTEMSVLFEICSAKAIKNYLGGNSQYRLIDSAQSKDKNYLGGNSQYKLIDSAWPKDMNFQEFCTEELFEKSLLGVEENFENHRKALTSDIIVWQPFDKMNGKIILLVQCKSGINWRKGHPVNLHKWKKLIDFACEPIRVYTITDLIMDNKESINYRTKKGWILDRARIIRLLADVDNPDMIDIRKDLQSVLDKIKS